MKKIVITAVLLSLSLFANEASDIIKRVDQNMRGKSVYMKIKMVIKSRGHSRSMEMETWGKGKKKSFVKIINPAKDRGITFLSLNGQMWQYIPKIERTIKIPPSMMLQNWMGSDITNDDMVKQSSLVDDYKARLISKKGTIATIELIPKPNAAVVWGKIITNIDTKHYTGVKDVFYDEDGTEVRTFTYSGVKRYGRYYLPTTWKVRPSNKSGHLTTLIVKDAKYDTAVSDQYFSKSALKRFSR
ncbi:MAG: outer membrane lipoprotein-sorting protein [Campylobacterota bacterium]|nr:outer membrane lipoprotein-sorting protein [Campylobacterota bacterium]